MDQELFLKQCEYIDHGKNRGVCTSSKIPAGCRVLEFTGKIVKEGEIPDGADGDYYLQIGTDTYMAPAGELWNFVNHSCDPNAGLVIENFKVYLVAIKDIEAGAEITFDYSTGMEDNDWTMECECGSKNCRKIIGEFKQLPEKVKEKYIKLGVVPNFVLKPRKDHG